MTDWIPGEHEHPLWADFKTWFVRTYKYSPDHASKYELEVVRSHWVAFLAGAGAATKTQSRTALENACVAAGRDVMDGVNASYGQQKTGG